MAQFSAALEDGGDEDSIVERGKAQIVEAVVGLRDCSEMYDVSFLVGKDGGAKRSVQANSTILALRSEYFRAMCFGPMRNDREKVISDMSPDTFERVLDYVHLGNRWRNCSTLDDVWELRYASSQFLLPDLEAACGRMLEDRLSHRNAIRVLRSATLYRSDFFRKKALRVMKNRHVSILSSDEIRSLEECDIIELIKLFRCVRTDYIIKAVFMWGKANKSDEEFRDIFKSRFFKYIRWDNLSNENMLLLHEIKMLPLELENEAMLRILGRVGPLPEEDGKTISELDLLLDFSSTFEASVRFRYVMLRTLISYKPDCVKAKWQRRLGRMGAFDVYELESEGMRIITQTVQSRPLTTIPLEVGEDISLSISVNHGSLRKPDALAAEAIHVRVDNRDIFYFLLRFDEVSVSPPAPEDEGGDREASAYVKVALAPELLRDLLDFNLRPGGGRKLESEDDLMDSPDPNVLLPASAAVRSWRSRSGEKESPSNIGSAVDSPRYFFEGMGLPVFVTLA